MKEAIGQQLLAGRLSRGERQVLEKDPERRERFLGPPVLMDAHLNSVLDLFWLLRRGTPSDQGIPITLRDLNDYDPVLLDLLVRLDAEYLSKMGEEREKQVQAAKAKSKR
jgi:hypothetical protein